MTSCMPRMSCTEWKKPTRGKQAAGTSNLRRQHGLRKEKGQATLTDELRIPWAKLALLAHIRFLLSRY